MSPITPSSPTPPEWAELLLDQVSGQTQFGRLWVFSGTLGTECVRLGCLDRRQKAGTLNEATLSGLLTLLGTTDAGAVVLVAATGGLDLTTGSGQLFCIPRLVSAREQLAARATPFVCVATSPTMGAVLPSLVAGADVVIATPDAQVALQGPRTMGEKAPADGETLLSSGMVDAVATPLTMAQPLSRVVALLSGGVPSRGQSGAQPQ